MITKVRITLSSLLLWALLAAFPSWAGDAPKKYVHFLEAVGANFSTWDTNHDDILSEEELNAAIENPTNTGPAAAALATLRRISKATNAVLPLTLTNIHKMADDKELKPWVIYGEALNRINHVTHRELFVSGLPQLSTIHQGRMGNCFCLAPLGAMLYRDPREVASWFETQTNGNILVKMAGGAISVPPPTDAELAFASGNSHDGIWINLYEKAIAEARNERKPPGKRFDVALDAVSGGGSYAPIMSYITGHKVRGYSLRFRGGSDAIAAEVAQLRERMAFATSNKLLMACSTVKPSTPGLTPKHVYALLEFNAAADTVKLWNPHGSNFKPKGPDGLTNGYFTTNGIFTVPFADWTNQFVHVAIERPELTPLKWPDQWELMAEAGRFAEAVTDLAAIIESDDNEARQRYLLTPLLIETGRLADYTNQCKTMLNEFEKTTRPGVAEETAKSCLLLGSTVSGDDLSRATNLASRAVSLSNKHDWMHWRYMTLGLAQYRAGQFEETLKTEELSQKALKRVQDGNGDSCEAETYFISAMAHEKLKRHEPAHTDLEKGVKIVETKLPKLDSGDLGQGWFDNLMANILMREAKSTVEDPTSPTKIRHSASFRE